MSVEFADIAGFLSELIGVADRCWSSKPST